MQVTENLNSPNAEIPNPKSIKTPDIASGVPIRMHIGADATTYGRGSRATFWRVATTPATFTISATDIDEDSACHGKQTGSNQATGNKTQKTDTAESSRTDVLTRAADMRGTHLT